MITWWSANDWGNRFIAVTYCLAADITGFDAEAWWPLNGPIFSPLNPLHSLIGVGVTGLPLSINWSGRDLQVISSVMEVIRLPHVGYNGMRYKAKQIKRTGAHISWHNRRWVVQSVPDDNSMMPSDVYLRQWTRPPLFQIMYCRLLGAESESEPMLAYCELDPKFDRNSTSFIQQITFENTNLNVVTKRKHS